MSHRYQTEDTLPSALESYCAAGISRHVRSGQLGIALTSQIQGLRIVHLFGLLYLLRAAVQFVACIFHDCHKAASDSGV